MSSTILACLAAILVGQLPALPDPTAQEIAAQVAAMGDDQFAVREMASAQLWRWGDRAEPALRAALQSKDAEIRIRAKSILDRFNSGLYPDISIEAATAVQQYRNGNPSQKLSAIERLKGLQDWQTLRRLLRSENDDSLKNRITAALLGDLLQRLTACVEAGDWTGAESLLQVESLRTDPLVRRQLATLYLLQGNLTQRIEQLQTSLGSDNQDGNRRLLATLLSAARRQSEAEEVLSKLPATPEQKLQAALEAYDWKRAAQLFDGSLTDFNFFQAALSATYHRAAGDHPTAKARIDQMMKLATPQQTWQTQKILLLHERFDEAVNGLKTTRPTMAFEILAVQHAFDEAFALANVRTEQSYDNEWFDALPTGDVLPDTDEQKLNRRHAIALQAAFFLHQVGETKDAASIFAVLRSLESTGSQESLRWRRAELCRIQLRLGLSEQALADATEYLVRTGDQVLMGTYFARQGQVAEQWRVMLQEQTGDEALAERLKKIHLLIRPSSQQRQDAAAQAMIAKALESIPAEKSPQRYQRVEAIAEALLAHGQRKEAIELLGRPDLSSLLYLRGGDHLREDGDYTTAAERYGMVGPKETHRATALYLHGVCAAALGEKDRARQLKQQAILLALDNPSRTLLFQSVASRRLSEDAAFLCDLWMRTSPELNSALAKEYGDATLEKTPALSADHWSAVVVRLASPNASLVEDAGYINLANIIHRARLNAALAKRDKEAAQRELAACLRIMPYSWEVVDDLVPKLEAAGWQAEADALFDEQYAKTLALAKKYPNSPRFSNAVAWIAASCRRHLDDALPQAERTLELAPNNPSYLDTLAEVHFARGDFAKAVATQRRVVELAPTLQFRQRLARFEAAAQP